MVKTYKKLRLRIIDIYGSQSEFAKVLGIKDQYLSSKLNGNVNLSMDDIKLWAKQLAIPEEEIGAYFFAEEV